MTTTMRVVWWVILIPSAYFFVAHVALLWRHRRRGEAAPSYVKSGVASSLGMASLASAELLGIDSRAGLPILVLGGIAVTAALVQSWRSRRAQRRDAI